MLIFNFANKLQTTKMFRPFLLLFLAILLVPSKSLYADTPTSIGLTGLINMPSARSAPDGTLFLGFSYDDPYGSAYATLQAMPWLQLSGRYTSVRGTKALTDDYGTLKDKSAGFKLRLLPENAFDLNWVPEIAVGMDDFHGTRLFRSEFIAASKKFNFNGYGELDATLGYGRHRINGLYGGVRYKHKSFPSWALLAEYDSTDYTYDPSVNITGVNKRKSNQLNYGLEYTWGPLTIKGAGHGKNRYSVNLSLSIPLEKREFTPKVYETGPFADGAWAIADARPTAQMWQDDRSYRQNMLTSLHNEGLRNVRLAWRDGVMSISVSSNRYRYPSRGVGRVARIALAYMPWETTKLEITWEELGVAGMSWTFFNIGTLERYFAGTATRSALANAMTINYASPDGISSASLLNDLDESLDSIAYEKTHTDINLGIGQFYVESNQQSRFEIFPSVRTILNDPSGAFKYDVGIIAATNLNLAKALWFRGAIRASVWENVSDVTQKSNSKLPHVRSDLALYRQASRVKVEQLLINKLWQPATRIYTRASVGIYEEMYAGVGGQALYLHPSGRWAVDGSVDFLKQRNYKGTGFLPYKTHTILGSFHYRMPWLDGVTATVRAGRFLAGDVGARLELKRRFKSGVEIGIWYTRTNGHDVTSPGTPSSPYFDKGVFMRIPLGSVLPSDAKSDARFSLAPWNRDVGQMVQSPLDLYDFAEHGWLNNALDGDGLRGFGDMPEEDTP